MRLRLPLHAIALAAVLLFSACDTAQERAEKYYQSGLAYVQAGDIDRALVEFRNVFKLDGGHRGARIAYAEAERKRGNLAEAYSQYLRLVEQYPKDLDGLRALAEMASMNGQWSDADRFLKTAITVAPDDLSLQALKIFNDYGAAVEANDTGTVVATVKAARDLRQKAPNDLNLRKVIIDDLVRAQSLGEAQKELDAAIAIAPQERLLYAQRLSVLAALGDDAAVESGLIEMVNKFPAAPEMQDALLRWYLSRKEYDKAEAYLRSRIDPKSDDSDPEIELIRFLGQYRGPAAAIAELDKAIAGGKAQAVFRSARAGFRFDQGDHAGAIADMQEILKTATPSVETRAVKVGLARMQLAVGQEKEARALVDDVLAEDGGQVEATKMKAAWLIQDDKVADAISMLRSAIDANPRDAGLMTLLAQAYDRDGNHDLVRDMLASAVEASGRAPDESLRYAQLLASEGKLVPAEGVLIDALRIAPGDKSLLVPLGQIYVQIKDWSRAEAVAKDLESLGDASVAGDITDIRTAILDGQQKTDQAVTYLDQIASDKTANLDAKLAVLRNHLNNGRNDKALAFAAAMLSDDPGNLDLQFINASVQAMTGDTADAEKAYRAVLAQDPKRPVVWLALYRILLADPKRVDEAHALIDQALKAVPTSGELRWAKAGLLEGAGDIEGAIAIYEQLYKENSANPIIANNLASLLSSYRKDPDSLARAAVIARRLRGSGEPPYQDTYGWIAYQTGDYQGAVDELEKAAAAIQTDPTVQYHLAMAYLGANRNNDAAKQFQKVLALVPANDSRDFVISAKSELEKLNAAAVAKPSP